MALSTTSGSLVMAPSFLPVSCLARSAGTVVFPPGLSESDLEFPLTATDIAPVS